jgi:iron-sulfur cluster assembly accessory protein
MNMRSAVDITDAAKAHIAAILANNPGKHLRVSINNRGCSGHKYEYELRDWDDREKFDETVDWTGGRLVIDGTSLLGLVGSELDLQTTQFESQLVWHNPMAVNACGCGESFQLVSDFHDHY